MPESRFRARPAAGPTPTAAAAPAARTGSRAGAGLHGVQRTHGNRAVQGLVARAQLKARTGGAADAYEREADRVAATVAAHPAVRGGGPDGVRRHVERALGVDLGGVRLHTGAHADGLNREADSLALTAGRDVYFRAGEYAPDTTAGRELIAHELTHVAQQAATSDAPAVQHKPGRLRRFGRALARPFVGDTDAAYQERLDATDMYDDESPRRRVGLFNRYRINWDVVGDRIRGREG